MADKNRWCENIIDHPQANSNLKVSTFDVVRNKRLGSTPAGSRGASAVAYIGNSMKREERLAGQDLARKAAIEAWERRWGQLPWDEVEFIGSYMSFQVIYEVRVCPR